MAKWIHDFNDLLINKSDIGKHFLFIIGPTGSGKTYLADLLCESSKKFSIVPNQTTRSKRDSDTFGHFNYLNPEQFKQKYDNNEFFLARNSPLPQYGYLKSDLNRILNSNSIAIFMFRFSGLNYLQALISGYTAVFLTSDPNMLCKMSKDVFKLPKKEEIERNLIENEKLYQKINSNKNTILKFENDYKNSLFKAREQILNIYNR